MNYKKIYEDFIEDRKQKQNIKGYYETHHIIPKALGGTNEKSNLIKLTAYEHLFAHELLARIYGGSMWYAVIFTYGGNKKISKKSRFLISKSKEETAKRKSKEMKDYYKNNPEKRKKQSELMKEKYKDLELIKRVSEGTKKALNDPEVKKKNSERMKKRWKNPEQIKKHSERMKGEKNQNSKKIMMISPEGKYFRYNCISDIGKEFNIVRTNISRYLKGSVKWPTSNSRAKPTRESPLADWTGYYIN
jgi:hypothetical protein